MFRAISYRIALQFTAFVFLLLLINGMIFLAVDLVNGRRQAGMRLARTAQFVMERTSAGPAGSIAVALPPVIREQVRVVRLDGEIIYSGELFEDIPFVAATGVSRIGFGDDRYAVLTTIMERSGVPIGYMQIAEIDRIQMGDLPVRAVLYIVISTAISAMTFSVGLFFARRSLKPAEQMVQRLEQFTQDASHELRTPVAAMNSSLDLALKTKDYRGGILSAKDDLKQITILVERLLELARADTFMLKKEVINMSTLVDTLAQRHRLLAADKHVTIDTAVEPDVMVEGDPSLVQQIVENLLTNAVKFSKPTTGKVILTLTKKMLTVEDNGIGIREDALPHIFDRFYQADSSRGQGGYGLGLSLVKRMVELHKWTISVKSAEGKGTVFRIGFSKNQRPSS